MPTLLRRDGMPSISHSTHTHPSRTTRTAGMGFEDRDYTRGSGGGSGYGGNYAGSLRSGGTAPAVKWLIIANVAVFVLQLIWTTGGPRGFRESVLQEWLELSPNLRDIALGPWRLITYAFCHSMQDIWHIVMNMYFLYIFGRSLERMYGTREFLTFYFVSALVGGVAFVGFALAMDNALPVVGASGAVMAVMMLYALHFPHEVIYILGIIPVPIWLLVGLYVILNVYPVLFALGQGAAGGNVAHAAHLGGLGFGYLYWVFKLRLSRLFEGARLRLPRLPRRKPSGVRLYTPPQQQGKLNEQVDAILDKIHREGEASLTDREREILKEASRRLKNR
jgi:membrane associated rhomboid family serine protease